VFKINQYLLTVDYRGSEQYDEFGELNRRKKVKIKPDLDANSKAGVFGICKGYEIYLYITTIVTFIS
jgi:hypothetical protein